MDLRYPDSISTYYSGYGYIFGIKPFRDITVISVTSENSNYPITNLFEESLDTYWQASTIVTQTLVLDLGTPLTDHSILFLYGTNVELVAVMGSNNVSMNPLVYSVGSIPVVPDIRTNVRRLWLPMSGNTGRYLRIDFVGDGIEPPKAHYLCVVDSDNLYVSSLRGFQFPYNVELFRPGRTITYEGDVGFRKVYYSTRWRCRFDLGLIQRPILEYHYWNNLFRLGENEALLFCENVSYPHIFGTEPPDEFGAATPNKFLNNAYLVKRIGEARTQVLGNLFETSLQFEEI